MGSWLSTWVPKPKIYCRTVWSKNTHHCPYSYCNSKSTGRCNEKFRDSNAKIFKSSFNRPNLYYEVRAKTKNIDHDIIRFVKQNISKSGIIYCLSRKRWELAQILQVNGINALPYHAGLDSKSRIFNQDQF